MLDKTIKNSDGKEYILLIQSEAVMGHAITICTNISGEFSGLSKNNELMEGQSLCYSLEYTNRLHDKDAIPFLVRAALLFVLLLIGWTVLYKLCVSDEIIFMYLWCSLSLLFAVTLTLFHAPDEYAHFYRAYEISYGDMIADYDSGKNAGGYNLPINSDLSLLKNSWQSYNKNKDMEISLEDSSFKEFSNTALYAPVSYIPQSIGIFIARHLTKNIAAIAYAGRFCNWLAITTILMFAIRMLPYGKRILMLVALMPMNIHESISMAPDGMVVALSALMIALSLRYRYEKENHLNRIEIAVLYLGAWTISLYKIVYLPFCIVYLLIPKERFRKGIREKLIHAGILICSVTVLSCMWLKLCNQFLTHAGTDGALQVQYVLSHPLQYCITFIRTYMNNGMTLTINAIGNSLGWLSIPAVSIITMLYFLAFVHSLHIGLKKSGTTKWMDRGIFGIIVFAIIILMTTSLYVQWTAIYSDSVSGLQGRYYLALFLPLYYMLTKDFIHDKNTFHIGYQTVVLITNICAATSMLFACI